MPGRRPRRDDPRDEQPAPRRQRTALTFALLASLLINHALLLPVAHLALRRAALPAEETAVELELAETPPKRERPRPPQRRRPPRAVKLAQLPQPQPPPPQQPPPRPAAQPAPPERQPVPRLKMVETDTPESERAPRDARFLSDKNRIVDRETRARNALRAQNRPRPQPLPARPQEPQRARPGEPRPRVAQSERSPSRRRVREERRRSPLMRMRQPLAQQRPAPRERADEPRARAPDADGELSLPRLPAHEPRRADQPRPLRLGLDHRDYDRIQGAQAQRERELARLQPSRAPGRRHQRKWERVRSALENFIPEVQPGNQTALGTRADPFAVYIARMHRQIHNHWGFGFLVDLDTKPDADAMNEMGLWSMVEIVVAPDGEVPKATLVRSSGVLTFDAAALDTVYSAGPYPRPPRAIRSADGKVYLHWRFHRDHRQCGTFGVDPYILTKPPDGPIDGDRREVGQRQASGTPERRLRRLHQPRALRAPRAPAGAGPAAARAAAESARAAERSRASARDPAALAAARRFTEAFAAGSAGAMAEESAIPFISQGRKVARSRAALARLFGHLLAEAPTRIVEGLSLLSLADARRRHGHLPRGATWGQPQLVARARLGGTPVTMLLARERGRWWVYGLDR